jgi:hypothetical protein
MSADSALEVSRLTLGSDVAAFEVDVLATIPYVGAAVSSADALSAHIRVPVAAQNVASCSTKLPVDDAIKNEVHGEINEIHAVSYDRCRLVGVIAARSAKAEYDELLEEIEHSRWCDAHDEYDDQSNHGWCDVTARATVSFLTGG